MLVVAEALFRVDRRITQVGETVEFLIAVADALRECGVARPVDTQPVLGVGVILDQPPKPTS